MCQSAWPYVPIPESGSARLNSPVILAARTRSALSRPRHALDPVQRCPEQTRAPAVLPSAPGKLGLARTFWLLEAHRNRRHGTRSCAFGGGKFPAWVRADALALLPGAEWPKIWPGAFGCLTKAFLRPPPAQTNHARGGIPVGGFGHPPPGRGGKGEPSRTRVGRARGESLWRRKERGDGGSKATGRTRRGGLVERPPSVEAGDYFHKSPGPPEARPTCLATAPTTTQAEGSTGSSIGSCLVHYRFELHCCGSLTKPPGLCPPARAPPEEA